MKFGKMLLETSNESFAFLINAIIREQDVPVAWNDYMYTNHQRSVQCCFAFFGGTVS